mmetsp:Transcript_4707/g.6112  ORF Transcript_4707/g.6112 Transcript_4707/m.6112 type:complete len:428 (+) Transcript_4707:622-1905(+)|eukprot:CAMPEP_0198155576 /NCGR_PEP_ID=MMETSP1443-20131203/69206_1 /TAXON_ID=186043 /ORGANISM="Entomoneis sp., Strain CCMP2396" /LENGTH=427 /DNA_ID=CAMNT_0043822331 /DNA_START=871 /DNA_END=2154 /DNA_ORIENTATION=+
MPAAEIVRSGSMAYPKSNTATYLAKCQFFARQHSRPVIGTVLILAFILTMVSDNLRDWRNKSTIVLRKNVGAFTHPSGTSTWGGAVHDGYFANPSTLVPENGSFPFVAVTDLDQLSKVDVDKPKWRSVMAPGRITSTKDGKYTIEFEKKRELVTNHNEAGRGAEFSELSIFNKRLLTFDDRTGDVFEILNTNEGQDSYVVPRFIITEGSGETDKGMKWEWSTVKGGELYMGSMGKAYTREDGSIVNTHNLWIAVLNGRGELRRENWADKYEVVRKALHATDPGYIIVEAVNWSDHLNKWVFMPRRISSDKYNENFDEKKGGTKIVLVDPDFSNTQVLTVTGMTVDPLRGFSSFAFVPGTKDEKLMAIRSVEEDCVGGDGQVCKQRSYLLIIETLTGKVVSDEVKFEEDLKFEGLEFVDINTKPPAIY